MLQAVVTFDYSVFDTANLYLHLNRVMWLLSCLDKTNARRDSSVDWELIAVNTKMAVFSSVLFVSLKKWKYVEYGP